MFAASAALLAAVAALFASVTKSATVAALVAAVTKPAAAESGNIST